MILETDLARIKQLAAERDAENWQFRADLKASIRSREEIDTLVHSLYEEIATEIDCTACANCCRAITPQPTQEDIERLSTVLGMVTDDFKKQYIDENSEEFKKPCPLLHGNLCSVYRHRPQECISYPHLQKEGFTHRLMQVLANYAICPIVFNVYERLKSANRLNEVK